MKTLTSALRHHLHFIIIVPLLIMVMTWPTFIRIFDQDGFWLILNNIDSNMLFWDAWYFKLLVSGQSDFYSTDLLFHPDGVSLAFHNFSLPHMAIFASLQAIMPPVNAFNLTHLFLVFLTSTAGYVYLNYLFRDEWIALFGAVVFGTGGFVLARPAHPNIAFIATLPLSLYFLHRGLLEERAKPLLIAGALIGATAFIGMYTLVCLLMTVPIYIFYFAKRKWKNRSFWLHLILLSLVVSAFLILRFYPMIVDPQGLSGALSKNENRETGKDLLGYFFNYAHPITTPIFTKLFSLRLIDQGWHPAVFLGYVPLLLIALAITRSKARRRLLPWLLLVIPFLILRLGSFLTVNGIHYTNLVLPKYYLAEAFPYLFKPFWAVDNFHVGVLFPFAVLTCCGLSTLLQAIPPKRRLTLTLILVGAVAFEYYQVQHPFVLHKDQLDFIEWLSQEDDQDSIRLINLPFGSRNSKIYGFYQTYNGYPHAEGRPTRTPAAAFDFINQNRLLSNWRGGKILNCLPGNRDQFSASRDQLLAAGFTHIILHHHLIGNGKLADNFVNVPAEYSDEFVSIYRVENLQKNCDASAFLSQDTLLHLSRVEQAAVVPLQGSSILSIHPFKAVSDEAALGSYSAVLYGLRGFVSLVATDQNDTGISDPNRPDFDPNTALAANSVILFAYNPRQSDAGLVDTYREWISPHFKFCSRLVDAEDTIIELFLLPDFPCNLAIADQPLAVLYDNGIQLGNLLPILNEDTLDLYLLWKRLPQDSHSFSIQFFDADGNKALGQDFVIGLEPLDHHRIDMSTLEPGDYQVKLIVYDFETRVSVPGTLISTESRFDRELKFEQITVGS